MGQMTQLAIEAWQRAAGLNMPTAEQRRQLTKMQEEALELIRVLELEASGIRDGDSTWHGDVLSGLLNDLLATHRLLLASYAAEFDRDLESEILDWMPDAPGAQGSERL